MKKTNSQKGITLVALIITIIVLLILAVVTIRAVQGNGIIKYAQNAKTQYEDAQSNELAMLQSYIDKLNGEETIIGAPLELSTYILGANKTGRDISELFDSTTGEFKDDETTEVDESTAVTLLYVSEYDTKAFMYIKYDNVAYKVVCDATGMTTESVEMVYKPQGREGQRVKYDSDGKNGTEDWIIITDRNGKVEIVSANVMYDADGNGLTLGKEDTSATVTSDLDGDGSTENDYEDIAIASYNNAITRINDYCKSLITAEEDKSKVRSVGASEEIGELEDNSYTSDNFNSWFKNANTVKVRKGDTKFEEDITKLCHFGIANAGSSYWVASRHAFEDSESVSFGVMLYHTDFGNIFSIRLVGCGFWWRRGWIRAF